MVGRQRDVRRLAARPHAAGRLREEAQRVRRGDARGGPGASSWWPSATSARGAKACWRERRDTWSSSASTSTAGEAGPGGARGADAAPHQADRRRAPPVPRDHPGAGGEEHPHRPRRVELLVRAAPLRRTRHALLPQGRPGHRGGHPRVLAPDRHHLHGQLRADGERDWRDQDHEDRRPPSTRPASC